MNNRWTDKIFDNAAKPEAKSGDAAADNTSTVSARLHGLFTSKDKEHTNLEKYRATIEPIKRRHAARKAGMPANFLEVGHAKVPEEVKRIKTDILNQIAELREEIEDLSDSCLAFMLGRKIRVKCVKRDALNALLDARTMDDMKHIAEREKRNPEVVAGIRSRTARLLDRIIYFEIESKIRLTRKD